MTHAASAVQAPESQISESHQIAKRQIAENHISDNHISDNQLAAKPTSGLFWLASYPKSGNTWLRAALASVRAGGGEIDINALSGKGDTISSSRLHFDRMTDVDSSDLDAEEILRARPRVFRDIAAQRKQITLWKAHEACIRLDDGEPLFPSDASAGAAYLVRDPRDVAVSLAHHMQRSLDETIAMMADPAACFSRSDRRLDSQLTQPLLSWSGHVRSWLDTSGPAGPLAVIPIRYEDMHTALESILLALTTAIGWPHSPQAIAGAVTSTRFERLQQQEQTHTFRERPRRMPNFFREGRVAVWRDALSAAQIAKIERDHGDVMADLGYL